MPIKNTLLIKTFLLPNKTVMVLVFPLSSSQVPYLEGSKQKLTYILCATRLRNFKLVRILQLKLLTREYATSENALLRIQAVII